MSIYIKHLPKDKLLYFLWLNAKPSANFYYCKHLLPKLDLETARTDINFMITNERELYLTNYYGRKLYVDISGDYVDITMYDLYNGRGTASKVINELKNEELQKSVLHYFKSF